MAEEYYDARVVEARAIPRRGRIREFHNAAKRDLLARFAASGGDLIDLACGRGGDMHKWRALGIRRAAGLDASRESVDEARRRATASGYRYEFRVRDLRLGLPPDLAAGGFDLAACMFAAQYFFDSEASAWALVRAAADCLRPGGHFVGIVPDARRVVERLAAGNGTVDDGVVSLRANWTGLPAAFGSAYACGVAGTIVDEANVEHLAYPSVLDAIATACGLERVPVAGGCFDDDGRLAPPYGGAEGDCTRMYVAFAYRKPPGP